MRQIFNFFMKNERTGFTLVEIIVSLALIAVVVITSLQFLIYCDSFAMKANEKIAAENFAREAMEGLYQKQYSDNTITANTNYGTNTLPTGAAFGSSLRDKHSGTRTYSVGPEQTDTLTNTQYKVITVTVTWNP